MTQTQWEIRVTLHTRGHYSYIILWLSSISSNWWSWAIVSEGFAQVLHSNCLRNRGLKPLFNKSYPDSFSTANLPTSHLNSKHHPLSGSDPLPIDLVLDKRVWISWFPRLYFCGRCRNLEFTIYTESQSKSFNQQTNQSNIVYSGENLLPTWAEGTCLSGESRLPGPRSSYPRSLHTRGSQCCTTMAQHITQECGHGCEICHCVTSYRRLSALKELSVGCAAHRPIQQLIDL